MCFELPPTPALLTDEKVVTTEVTVYQSLQTRLWLRQGWNSCSVPTAGDGPGVHGWKMGKFHKLLNTKQQQQLTLSGKPVPS